MNIHPVRTKRDYFCAFTRRYGTPAVEQVAFGENPQCGIFISMSTNIKDKGPVAKVLDEDTSDSEMDTILAGHRDEVEALLQEARDAKAQRRYAPLEPLYVFLRRARERFKAAR